MHRSLVKAIAIESGGALSKQVLNACNNLIMPGFASSWFYFRAVLIIYVGGGFYASFELGKFDIPTSYDEIWKLTKIARIMLQIKVGNIPQFRLKIYTHSIFFSFMTCRNCCVSQFLDSNV